ncbi:MAG: creatininase family protein [Chloroflexota bacterium]|nr:creatininase family protein [Chloroflexota bacterium]
MAERNNNGRKILWYEMTLGEFEEAISEGASVILPVGSMEQHGYHLPVSVDINDSYHMALEAARRAEDLWIIVAPPVWSGFSPPHVDFPGTISLRLNTFINMFMEICTSIYRQGFRKILILNGHGSTPLAPICEQLAEDKVSVLAVTWWDLIADELRAIGESPLGGMSHACEAETSLQMVLQPHALRLELMESKVIPPLISFAKHDLRDMGPIVYGFNMKRQSATGVLGDPTVASAEKGQAILDAVADKLVLALREYDRVDW